MKRTWFFALSLVFVPFAGAQVYQVVDLGPLVPVSINTEGEVAGNVNGVAAIWTAAHGMHPLGTLPGGTFSIASGINDLGVVAGTADGAGAVSNVVVDPDLGLETVPCADLVQPFTWTQNGGFVTPPSIPSAWTDNFEPCSWVQDFAAAINNRNQVAGFNTEIDTYQDGFSWNAQNSPSLLYLGFDSRANAMNDYGIIVGQGSQGEDLTESSHAYAAINGTAYDLGTLGGDSWNYWSGATSISDTDTIVGWSSVGADPFVFPSVIHAFAWTGNSGMYDLGTLPGDQSSAAIKVTTTGLVVGMSGNTAEQDYSPQGQYTAQVTGHPFVWTASMGMKDLNAFVPANSGWVLNTVADANVWGQAVGTGTYNGTTHGYLLTPKILFAATVAATPVLGPVKTDPGVGPAGSARF